MHRICELSTGVEMHPILLGTDTFVCNAFAVQLTRVFLPLNAEILSDADSLPPVADYPVCRAYAAVHFYLVNHFYWLGGHLLDLSLDVQAVLCVDNKRHTGGAIV